MAGADEKPYTRILQQLPNQLAALCNEMAEPESSLPKEPLGYLASLSQILRGKQGLGIESPQNRFCLVFGQDMLLSQDSDQVLDHVALFPLHDARMV